MALIDEQAYLAANPDVAAAVARGEMTAEQHYLNYGQFEGRAPDGSNSGAQINFWDAPEWQEANPGGTRESGIQSANFDVNLSGIPGTKYYQVPYQWEGKTYGGRLDDVQMNLLQERVAAGEDYNTVAMRLLGDGIGTGSSDSETGPVLFDYDVGTGTWVPGGTAGGTIYDVKDGKITGASRDNNATSPQLQRAIKTLNPTGIAPPSGGTGGVMPPPYGTDGIDSNWFNTQPGYGNGNGYGATQVGSYFGVFPGYEGQYQSGLIESLRGATPNWAGNSGFTQYANPSMGGGGLGGGATGGQSGVFNPGIQQPDAASPGEVKNWNDYSAYRTTQLGSKQPILGFEEWLAQQSGSKTSALPATVNDIGQPGYYDNGDGAPFIQRK